MLNAIHTLIRRLSNRKLKGRRRRPAYGGLTSHVETLEGRQLLSATTFSWSYSPTETAQDSIPAEVSIMSSHSEPDSSTDSVEAQLAAQGHSDFRIDPNSYRIPPHMMNQLAGVDRGEFERLKAFENIKTNEVQRMYRVFNTGADFTIFTTDKHEYDTLKSWGLQDQTEGRPGFEVLKTASHGAQPIHRLYNPNNSQHYFTMNDGERDFLVHAGWNAEPDMGNAFSQNTAPFGTSEVYMLYKTEGGDHLFTTDYKEVQQLLAGTGGWEQQTSLGFAFHVSSHSIDEGDAIMYYGPNGTEISGTLHVHPYQSTSGPRFGVTVTVRGVDIPVDLQSDYTRMSQALRLDNKPVWLSGSLYATESSGTELPQVRIRPSSLLAFGEQPVIRPHTMIDWVGNDPVDHWLDANFGTHYRERDVPTFQVQDSMKPSTSETTSNGIVTTSKPGRGITGGATAANKSKSDGPTLSQGSNVPIQNRNPEQPPITQTPFGKPGENWETTKKAAEIGKEIWDAGEAIWEAIKHGKGPTPAGVFWDFFGNPTKAGGGKEQIIMDRGNPSDPERQQLENEYKLQQQNQEGVKTIQDDDHYWQEFEREFEQFQNEMNEGIFKNQTPYFPGQSQRQSRPTPSNRHDVTGRESKAHITMNDNATGNEPPISPDLFASGDSPATYDDSDWEAIIDQLFGSQMPGESDAAGEDTPGLVAWGQMSPNGDGSDWSQLIDQLFGNSSYLDQLVTGGFGENRSFGQYETDSWEDTSGYAQPWEGIGGNGDPWEFSVGYADSWNDDSGYFAPVATSDSVFNGLGDGSNSYYAGWPSFNNANDLGAFYTAAAQQHTFTPTGYDYNY